MFARPKPDDITTIHATTIAIGSHAVMLLGLSGTGKSDLAMRLIDRGAMLVSDDQTMLTARAGRLIAAPPETLAGKIEVRGIGIIDIPWRGQIPVALAVRLTERYDRMPSATLREPFAGIDVPTVMLNAFEGSAPIKVERALERVLAAAAT
jgi:serine kinase of HPr protein (carbohydrate metabolism regulator)